MPEPGVSVVIPVRDGERYLGEAIESALGQAPAPVEVIVVDDGSSDGSAAVASGYAERGVSVVRQEAAGIGAARNRGVRASSGEVLAFLDGDDVWEPRKLEHQLAALRHAPAPDLVFGYIRQFRSPDLDPTQAARIVCPAEPQPAPAPSTMMLSRAAFDRVGEFATGWPVGEVLDWLIRARELGLREVMLPDVLARRRLHLDNNSRRQSHRISDHTHILKAALDRRRAGRPSA